MSRRKLKPLSNTRREALVATIQAALTTAAAAEVVECVASLILTRGHDAEMFIGAPTGDAPGLIAAVLAFATRAPDAYLALMAETAEREIKWTENHVRQLAYEAEHGHAPRGRTPINADWHPEDQGATAAA